MFSGKRYCCDGAALATLQVQMVTAATWALGESGGSLQLPRLAPSTRPPSPPVIARAARATRDEPPRRRGATGRLRPGGLAGISRWRAGISRWRAGGSRLPTLSTLRRSSSLLPTRSSEYTARGAPIAAAAAVAPRSTSTAATGASLRRAAPYHRTLCAIGELRTLLTATTVRTVPGASRGSGASLKGRGPPERCSRAASRA